MSEIVNVPIPSAYLAQVYRLIGELDNGSKKTAPAVSEPTEADPLSQFDEWTPKRIRRMVEESPAAVRDILKELANRPNQWVSTQELAEAIQGKDDADWNTVAGTLGAFGRRCKNRYGMETLPFEGRRDPVANCKLSRMPANIASEVLRSLNNGD